MKRAASVRLTKFAALSINTMQRGGKVDRLKEAAHRAVKNYISAKPHQAITPDMVAAVNALILDGWRPTSAERFKGWSEEIEERMMHIGQNGNTGYHYPESKKNTN